MRGSVTGSVSSRAGGGGRPAHPPKSAADEQLSRKPFPLPVMKINPGVKSIFEFKYDDFELVGYEAHPHIKASVAV